MDINLINLFSLGGISFHFGRRIDGDERLGPVERDGVTGRSVMLRTVYSSDARKARSGELSDEHDGSPVYVDGVPMYLVGGAVIEELLDLSHSGLGSVRVRYEIFHRKGQVYMTCRSLDDRVAVSSFERITDVYVSGLAENLRSVRRNAVGP